MAGVREYVAGFVGNGGGKPGGNWFDEGLFWFGINGLKTG